MPANSKTAHSKTVNPGVHSEADNPSPRAIYRRIFLATVLGMGVAMGLVRLLGLSIGATSNDLLERVQEARQALPQIVAEEQPVVLAFGSSMTDAGFAARQFDREMAERGVDVKSFNFGFGGLNPLFQDYLSRRIRDAFQAEDRRLELAILEFCPFQVTQARYDGARPVIDSFVTLLATPQEIWDLTLEDPARGVRIFNIYYFRDKISAELATHALGDFLRPGRPRSGIPEDEEAVARRGEIVEILTQRFEEDYPDYADTEWSYEWQGAGTIPEERSESTLELFREYYDTLRTERGMTDDRLHRIACCDIEELHFEEELVAAYVRIIENFQQFSDHVEVVLLPRNTEWIHYSPEASARLEAVLDRLREETGVSIRNYQLLEGYPPEMWSDTTHFARYSGDVVFTRHLVEEFGPLLGGTPALEETPAPDEVPAPADTPASD